MSRIAQLAAAANDIETETVPLPKWGCTVEVRGMDGNRRSQYLARLIKAREEEDTEALGQLEAELVVACTFDPEDGSQAFTEGDIAMLMGKSGFYIGALAMKAQRMSGLDLQAEERLGKGSLTSVPTDVSEEDSTPSVASISASVAN
jgi:hypothetical protein